MVEVWAPSAPTVSLEINGHRVRMEKTLDGYWLAGVKLNDGEFYSFEINERSGPPDPRSPAQPNGVHGPSCHVDHSLIEWTDQHWQAKPVGSAIIYEVHLGTFTEEGTFEAAIEHLRHLIDLGVAHVELMPVAAFQGNHGWGYDGVALFAPHPTYGGPVGLKKLVDTCHAGGLGILLDVVYNHLATLGTGCTSSAMPDS